ncbi:uncharacterized protein LOC111266989 [Varroa jacobsoni]|uniref:uncharacterized protein LOC111266989 n=1 Tax=Varroa jacobsoni TaxID=62625 RepID=UPI000BF29A6E|nr:uncharacterized protein LOC111266989 [Varroa jacobsoni]
MAEEEVISPSPTEKRHARFQRPSLEQRQKLLAIAHDITNVLDTYSKEYSDSEKSSKYSSRLMELLGRASHKSPRTSDEQVQTKLKAIEERIVQVEKEILQMSQQTKPKQAKPHRSKGLTAKRTGKSKSGSSDKNISSSPNLYPTIIECSVEQSSVTMNGFKSLKSYRVQQQSSLSKYDTVAEAANPQKNRSTNDLADVLKSAVSKTKKGRVSPLNKILTRLKAVSKPPAKACLLKAEMPAAKQVVADTSDELKSKPLIVLVTEEISTRRQTEKTPIKSQQPLPSQKKAPSGLPSLKKDHLPIVISSEKGSSFPKSTDVSKTRSPKEKFVEKLSPLAAEKSALEGMQYSPTDVSPTPRNMDSDKEQDGDAEEPLSSPTSDDESHDIKTPRRERA